MLDPVNKIDTARKLSADSAAKLKKARQTLNRCKRGRCPVPQVQALLEDAARDFAAVDLLLAEASVASAGCAQLEASLAPEPSAEAVAQLGGGASEGEAAVVTKADGTHWGMPAEEFSRLLAQVEAQVFAEDRILLAREAAKAGSTFSCGQVRALMGGLVQSSDKLDLLRAVKGRVADTQNLDTVYGELHHPADLEEARRILEGGE
jgi:hypothetical protein